MDLRANNASWAPIVAKFDGAKYGVESGTLVGVVGILLTFYPAVVNLLTSSGNEFGLDLYASPIVERIWGNRK